MTEKSKLPLVAVTGPDRLLRVGWWSTRLMLRLCGLRACYLTAANPHLPEAVQGIVIGGGDDIEPAHYGAAADTCGDYDRPRDRFEMAMCRRALEAQVPLLGICRGAQLINVVLGGSLHLDIRTERRLTPQGSSALPVKWVDFEGPSQLREALQRQSIKVNQLHSQAIRRHGRGLRTIARDRDGFVQAVEGEQGFLLGVQWHPEYLPYSRDARGVFKLFASAVRGANTRLQGLDAI